MGVVKAGVVAGAEYKAPVTPFLCAGDRARLEMDLDLLKSSLDVLGTWDDKIVDVSYYTCGIYCECHYIWGDIVDSKNLICTCARVHRHMHIYVYLQLYKTGGKIRVQCTMSCGLYYTP